MSSPADVSVMIFTLNEEVNLPVCLASLDWCDDVIVIDSFSADGTVKIAEERGARVYQRAFDGFGTQRNWALDHVEPRHEWIMILDADERVPPGLAGEIGEKARTAPTSVAAYRVRRRFHLWGRWLRYSGLYPTWVVRFIRRGRVRYVNRGHAETQEVDGEIGDLDNDLIDENFKGMDEWFERQNRYSTKDAEFEIAAAGSPGGWRALLSKDALERRAGLKRLGARVPFRPTLYFLYSYLFRLGFLDGRDGFVFCRMKAMYQQMVRVKKYDMTRRRDS